MSRSLSGKTIAVIGGSGGLGAPTARRLADAGTHVVLAGPHGDRLERVGIDGAEIVELDLRDPSAGDILAAQTKERFGRLDGVVNAAGIVAFGPLLDTDDTVIEELFLTNVMGPLWLIKRLIPMLSDSHGFVVNISAVVAEQPLPNMAAYSATKAALTAVDRSLARELRRVGIRVCDVRPPHTETGLAERPLAGAAPALPPGLRPEVVAERIVEAIIAGTADVSSESFADLGNETVLESSRPS